LQPRPDLPFLASGNLSGALRFPLTGKMEVRCVAQRPAADLRCGKALRPRDPNVPLVRRPHPSDSRHLFPIPKGDTPYSRAKRYEYVDKDLSKAAFFYQKAIEEGDRAESAVKDLAGVLHQQGQTSKACETLERYRHLFAAEPAKFDNLLLNLKKQVPANTLSCKFLKLTGVRDSDTPTSLRRLFTNPNRIHSLVLYGEATERYALLQFATHSAARKSIDSFASKDTYKLEWVVGGKTEDGRSDGLIFNYVLFSPASTQDVFPIPVDASETEDQPSSAPLDFPEADLLGAALVVSLSPN